MTMQDFLIGAAILSSAACLFVFVVGALAAIRAMAPPAPPAIAGRAAIPVDDLTKLFEAIAKLVDSLAKAGPTISSLVGALGFLAIAATMVK